MRDILLIVKTTISREEFDRNDAEQLQALADQKGKFVALVIKDWLEHPDAYKVAYVNEMDQALSRCSCGKVLLYEEDLLGSGTARCVDGHITELDEDS